MAELNPEDKDRFLYARASYHGEFTPENLVFSSNLQEFAHKVGYITNLETAGKLSPQEAYKRIKVLWKQLKSSKKELGIGATNGEEPSA